MNDNFKLEVYRKILDPILCLESEQLKKVAYALENRELPEDDNLYCEARLQTAEVLRTVARLNDFVDYIFSGEMEKDIEEYESDRV